MLKNYFLLCLTFCLPITMMAQQDRWRIGSEIYINVDYRVGNYSLVFQGDGNLVIVQHMPGKECPIFNTRTANQGATRCVFQGDGNLVIGTATQFLWNSQTSVSPNIAKNRFLQINADGNLVIYDSSSGKPIPIWNMFEYVAKAENMKYKLDSNSCAVIQPLHSATGDCKAAEMVTCACEILPGRVQNVPRWQVYRDTKTHKVCRVNGLTPCAKPVGSCLMPR
ncbi:hypothetical protein [Puia dinghuensis]|uniref:hypothetical protein n=1 Tax=Puia dinghuensis TaxID=1792502 RepID=UPI001667FE3D|nr:hypothetical protein [Puia dinghuensis]